MRSMTSSASLGNIDRWRERWYLLYALEQNIKRENVVPGVAYSIDSTLYSLVSQRSFFALEGRNSIRDSIPGIKMTLF
jgi:hypothetical protein